MCARLGETLKSVNEYVISGIEHHSCMVVAVALMHMRSVSLLELRWAGGGLGTRGLRVMRGRRVCPDYWYREVVPGMANGGRNIRCRQISVALGLNVSCGGSCGDTGGHEHPIHSPWPWSEHGRLKCTPSVVRDLNPYIGPICGELFCIPWGRQLEPAFAGGLSLVNVGAEV